MHNVFGQMEVGGHRPHPLTLDGETEVGGHRPHPLADGSHPTRRCEGEWGGVILPNV